MISLRTRIDPAPVTRLAFFVLFCVSAPLLRTATAAPNTASPAATPALKLRAGSAIGVKSADPVLQEAREGRETEAQTVQKCLRDLNSEDVLLRRRATMILGKYRNASAQQAIVGALSDPDAEVRRSALVSISENSVLPVGADLAVVRLILDPDIHSRRIASSMARDALRSQLRAPLRPPGLVGTIAPMPAKSGARPEMSAILNRALSDPDPTVRKNILSLAPYAPGALSVESIRQCFASEDGQVRYLALKAYVSAAGRSGSVEDVVSLATDPDPIVRRQLATALSRFGEDGIVALRGLANDLDPQTRLEAVKGIVRLQDPEGFPLLAAVIRDEKLPIDDRRGLGPYVLFYRDQALPLLRELASESRPPLQTEAVRLLGNSHFKDVDVGFFLGLLCVGSEAVRSAAGSVLNRRSAELVPDQVRELMQSAHPDVRQLGLRLSRILPGKEGDDVLLDACLDDDTGVRCVALTELSRRHVDGATDILAASLADDDAEVRKAAVDGLLARPSPATFAVLQTFLSGCTDTALRIRIQRLLQSRQVRPGVSPRRVLPPRTVPRSSPARP